MKTYKNYTKNQKSRRNDPNIRKIKNGEVVSRWSDTNLTCKE